MDLATIQAVTQALEVLRQAPGPVLLQGCPPDMPCQSCSRLHLRGSATHTLVNGVHVSYVCHRHGVKRLQIG